MAGGVPRTWEADRLQVIYADAGQGDCTLITFPDGTNWMIDCGCIKNGKVVKKAIQEMLERELPDREIDLLILTHPDQDHYNLLKDLYDPDEGPIKQIHEVMFGGKIEQYKNARDGNFTYNLLTQPPQGIKVLKTPPKAAFDWKCQDSQFNLNNIDGVDANFLCCNFSYDTEDTNNTSITLMLTHRGHKFFFMGDAEAEVEEAIIKAWDTANLQTAADKSCVLKLGHHGSNTSSTQQWIETIRPTHVVVSADTRAFGKNDRSMPALSLINNIITWSKRIAADIRHPHSYVVWCDDENNQNYYQKPMSLPTDMGICTTLCKLDYEDSGTAAAAAGAAAAGASAAGADPQEYESTGSSWYYGVDQNGVLRIKWTGDGTTGDGGSAKKGKARSFLVIPQDNPLSSFFSKDNVSPLLNNLTYPSSLFSSSSADTPITVSALQSLLSKATSKEPFVLKDTSLGMAAVQQLFHECLPENTLTIIAPSAAVETLSVSGQISFPAISSTQLNVSVEFSCDETKTYVTGISIRITCYQKSEPDWTIKTSFLTISANFLKDFGCSTLYLLLAAAPDSNSEQTIPQYGIGVDFPFTSSEAKINTLAFNALSTQGSTSYTLEGEFDKVNFSLLNSLSCFATKSNFNIIPQDLLSIPMKDLFELKSVKLLINQNKLGEYNLLAAFIGVQIAESWTLIPKIFEFKNIDALFTIIYSTSPDIYVDLYTTFQMGPILLEASIDINFIDSPPQVSLEAAIKEPTNTSDLLHYLDLPSDLLPSFSITYLRFYINFNERGYSIICSTEENWTIMKGVELSTLSFAFSGSFASASQTSISSTLEAVWMLGQGKIYLSAAYQDKGWAFQGGTIGTTSLAIGDLITYIGNTFGIHDIPSFIQKITLSDLYVLFETVTHKFSFAVTGNIPIANHTLSITIAVDLTTDPTTHQYNRFFRGTVDIAGFTFTLDLEKNVGENSIFFSWSDSKKYLNVADLLQAIGFQAPELPIDLELKSVGLAYNFTSKEITLIAHSLTYGIAVFTCFNNQKTNQWEYFFALSLDKTLDLTPSFLLDPTTHSPTITINPIQIVASNGIDPEYALQANNSISTLIHQMGETITYPTIPTEGVPRGAGFLMTLNLASHSTSLHLTTASLTSPKPAFFENAALKSNDTSGSNNTLWIHLEKTLGPLSLKKMGVSYRDKKLIFVANLSFSLKGLNVTLSDFGITFSVANFSPEFTLSGIDIECKEGPIEISGALFGSLSPLNFMGEALLQCPELSLKALAGYATVDDHPSLFLYAVLNQTIGGPPLFFVTGLAAGLGFNRKLMVPTLEEVSQFPFVAWALGDNPPSMDMQQKDSVLSTLASSGCIAPAVGQDWLVFGVHFTSFELVDSFALLTVVFGIQFEVDILGLSRICLPSGADSTNAIAFAELAIKASFSSDLIAIAGQLTSNSYLFSQDCHLTGGFAFYFWLSGTHAGDFVVSIGGYSPHFTPPSYYPAVPRLGINWQIGSNLTIQGSCYFAVTSNAIMAGGGLSAVWSSDGVSAWFIVQADFLLVYLPFHYYIEASISLGASVNINLLVTNVTLTIHLGVDIAIWGPDFSGKATINLYIFSFSIDFGSSSPQTDTHILWSDFATKLLPQNTSKSVEKTTVETNSSLTTVSAINIQVTKGLYKKVSDESGKINCLVHPKLCELNLVSTIPIKNANLSSTKSSANIQMASDDLQPQVPEKNTPIVPVTEFGVGPTGTSSGNFASTFCVAITPKESQNSTFSAVRVLQNIPKALWECKIFDDHGVPANTDPVHDTTISHVLVGYKIIPHITPPHQLTAVSLKDLVFETDVNHIQSITLNTPFCPTQDTFNPQQDSISQTITKPSVQNIRQKLLEVMIQIDLSVTSATNIDISELSHSNDLNSSPLLRLLGEEKGVPL